MFSQPHALLPAQSTHPRDLHRVREEGLAPAVADHLVNLLLEAPAGPIQQPWKHKGDIPEHSLHMWTGQH